MGNLLRCYFCTGSAQSAAFPLTKKAVCAKRSRLVAHSATFHEHQHTAGYRNLNAPYSMSGVVSQTSNILAPKADITAVKSTSLAGFKIQTGKVTVITAVSGQEFMVFFRNRKRLTAAYLAAADSAARSEPPG